MLKLQESRRPLVLAALSAEEGRPLHFNGLSWENVPFCSAGLLKKKKGLENFSKVFALADLFLF